MTGRMTRPRIIGFVVVVVTRGRVMLPGFVAKPALRAAELRHVRGTRSVPKSVCFYTST